VWCTVKLLENKDVVSTNFPHFFHFTISGLEQLVERYGRASPQFTDALTLLKTVSQRVSFTLFIQSLSVINCSNNGNSCQDF